MCSANGLRAINPDLQLTLIDDFINKDNLAEHFASAPDGVLDAIDSLQAKVSLLAWCKNAKKITVVTTGGAGGQIDPSQIAITDVAKVTQDSLNGESA